MSTFNPAIPQANDRLAKSQQDLLGNNRQLDISFGIDHIPFSVATNMGKHRQVQILNQLAIPPGLAGGQVTLYSKNLGGGANLFFTRGASAVEVQITRGDPFPFTNNYTPDSGGGPVGASYSAGSSFLPGGLLLQYGTFNAGSISPSSGTIKFPRTFTTAASIIVSISFICKAGGTSQASTISIEDGTVTTTDFKWNSNTSTTAYVGFTWSAIGS